MQIQVIIFGIAAALLSLASPAGAWLIIELKASEDPELKDMTKNRKVGGLIGYYVQLNTVFSSLLLFIISGILYFLSNPPVLLLKYVVLGTTIFSFVIFVWLFPIGGATRISFDHYLPKEDSPKIGKFHFPPWHSPLTWIRIAIFLLGLVFALWGLVGAK